MNLKLWIWGWLLASFLANSAGAITDPRQAPNNRFGIHLVEPLHEASEAAALVNSNGGDWGYVTVVIQDQDLDKDKWQKTFDTFRKLHLIPLVRLATHVEGSTWQRPTEESINSFASFLNQLVWPVQNRYVIIYNEPNHSQEWGGKVDAASYALILDKAVEVFKNTSEDFFILPAGLDAAAPSQLPFFEDSFVFMAQMDQNSPGILQKIDGWTSHSYPNPHFSQPPDKDGKTSIKGYLHELRLLKEKFSVGNLPVFITETGWRHNQYNDRANYPHPEMVADYFDLAFTKVWNDGQIVAVTPFLFNYLGEPFEQFSWKRSNSQQVLAARSENVSATSIYYPQFDRVKSLTKPKGEPTRHRQIEIKFDRFPRFLLPHRDYPISATIHNMGQTIVGEEQLPMLTAIDQDSDHLFGVSWTKQSLEPGQIATVSAKLKTFAKEGTRQIGVIISDQDGPLVVKSEEVLVVEPVSTTVSLQHPCRSAPKLWLSWFVDILGYSKKETVSC